jgi:hypothetical protein
MITKSRRMILDSESDPFGERSTASVRKRFHLLGGDFRFESSSAELMQLVQHAYAGLPRHRLSSSPPLFRVKLMLTPTHADRGRPRLAARREPAPISMIQGADFLGGVTDSSTFVVLSPGQRTALLSVSPEMLHFPYHTRYELIEFAVFTLAHRAQRMVSLHAACVGLDGRGILLMGPSGSGKSTIALHCLLNGFDFLSEDSVFVAPNTMRATGISNFLHVRSDSLVWLGRTRQSAIIRKSPVIRRRSGVAKFEVDLRRQEFRLAQMPLKIVAVAFLTSDKAATKPILRSLRKSELRTKMCAMQAYGASLPEWRAFSKKVSRLGGFEVRRGNHPLEAVQALRSLLMRGGG